MHFPELIENSKRFLCLHCIDAAHRKSDMHEHPVANAAANGVALIHDAADIDLPPYAAHIDGCQHIVGIIYFRNTARNAEDIISTPFGSGFFHIKKTGSTDGCLAKKSSAVIGGNFGMRKHYEASPRKPSCNALEQNAILEAAARQSDPAKRGGCLAYTKPTSSLFRRALSQSVMKTRGYRFGWNVAAEIVQ